jgi:hypothetical protein
MLPLLKGGKNAKGGWVEEEMEKGTYPGIHVLYKGIVNLH